MVSKCTLVGLVLAAAAGLGGCMDGYGYGGLDVGYGAPGYYDAGYGYGGGYYDAGYGAGYYGGLGYGWYGDYYYPGNGYYVYDRYRRPYRWNDGQRRYWEGRRGNGNGGAGVNWGGFNRGGGSGGRFDGRPNYNGNYTGGDRSRWNGNGGRAGNPTPQAQPQYQRPPDGERSFTRGGGGGALRYRGGAGPGSRGERHREQ